MPVSRGLKSQALNGYLPLALAVVFFFACTLLVSPKGEFPINDDYTYYQSVLTFLSQGRIELFASSSSCYLHILAGALIAKLFGFSYENLRFLSIAATLIAILALYHTARRLEVSRELAGLACLVFAVNPLVINLQFSYMTDMPAVALISCAQLLTITAIKSENRKHYLLAGLVLMISIGIRQSCAIWALPNLLLIALKLMKRQLPLLQAALLVVVPVVLAVALDRYMESSGTMLDAYHCHKERARAFLDLIATMPRESGQIILLRAGQVIAYLSVFLLPFIVASFKRENLDNLLDRSSLLWAPALAMVAGTLYGVFANDDMMPFFRNLWHIDQIGSRTIVGNWHLARTSVFYVLATASVVVLSLLLLPLLVNGARLFFESLKKAFFPATAEDDDRDRTAMLYAGAVFLLGFAYCVFHIAVRGYDRYLVDLLVPALVFVCLTMSRLNLKPAIIPALLIALSMGALCEGQQETYMSWNRARWQAIASLEEKGIPPARIDGGAEHIFNTNIAAWNLFVKKDLEHTVPREKRGQSPYNLLRWWPVFSEDYVISFIPLAGYRQIDSVPFHSWLPWKYREVLVLENYDIPLRKISSRYGHEHLN
ncbi:MAG: ArnT family glycosyltransferase [Candidatus Obscuribacterales bacterium]